MNNLAISANAIAVLPRSSFELLVNNPERLLILSTIAKKPNLTFTDLHKEINIAKSSLHRHLKVLTQSGWITQIQEKDRRLVYKPSALVYLCYEITNSSLSICRDYVLVIVPYCRCIVMKMGKRQLFTTCHTDSCSRKLDCFREVRKLARRLSVDISSDEVTEAIVEVYWELALNEIRSLTMPLIMIPINKTRMLCRELLLAL